MSVLFKTQNWEPGANKASQVNGIAPAQTMPNSKTLIRHLLRSEVGASVV